MKFYVLSLTVHHSPFTVKYVRVRIYDPNDRAVGRGLVPLERKRSLFPATPKNKFTYSGPDRIKGNHRFTLVVQVRIQ